MTQSPSAPLRSTLEATFPLSPAQQGMLYHTLLEPEAGVFLEQMVGWLPEALEVERLLDAWRSAVARHSALRTGFRFAAEGGIQEVHPRAELESRVEDWRGLAPDQQERRLEEFLAADRVRGFALETPPLHRLALFRLGAAEYRMVFTFHHAILDGRGLAVLFQDVFGAYEAGLERKPWTSLRPPEFRNYVEWLGGLDLEGAERYWRTTLAGFSSPTPLVVDRPVVEPGEGQSRQAHLTRWLHADTTKRLAAAAEAHQVTLNTVMQGAWALLLSRYSGESDVVFGVTRACRRTGPPGTDSLVAHLTNVLPLRVRVDPKAPFFQWLGGVRDQWSGLRAFEHTPPAQVLAWSDLTGSRSLFDSVVTFDVKDWSSALQTPTPLGRARRFDMFELTSYPLGLMAYGGDRASLKVEYDRRRFDARTIVRMLSHLETLLVAAAADPDMLVKDLPILPADERARILEEWNPRVSGGPPGTTLTQQFEAQALATPSRIAVECQGRAVTYADLNAAANRVARRLRALGISADTLVAICADRSIDLLIGLLGVLKAGGAYVPIDLTTPAERVAFILEDSAAPVLLTQRHLVDRLPGGAHTTLVIEELAASGNADNLPALTSPDNLAYVIYTSGSTGKPKGVLVTHRNVTRLFTATDHWFGFGPDDVWTLFHSYAFDFSVWEIWGALLYGGRLVVVPYDVSRSPEAFVELVARAGVTVLNQTPSAFRQFIEADQALGIPALALRWVIFGGEALDLASLKPWFASRGDKQPRLVNMYGITETTVHVTFRPLTLEDVTRGSVIGVPIPDLQVYILDELLRPVPIGVPGEMYVGGAGVARGYLRRDDLTSERFVAHPFRSGERLYRTGDRARFLPERDIEYLGRLDFQVKIRGFRIELGEIEAALGGYSGVREALVLCREDHPGEKRLVAYFTAVAGAAPSVPLLRAHLQSLLPDYMVPAAFVPIAAFPLTENGKVDRRALPPPTHRSGAPDDEVTGPRSPGEALLAPIWQTVLRIDAIGRHDNYFELGGDSILSIQIAARAREVGLLVTVGLLVKHPTIASLAAALDLLPRRIQAGEDQAIGDAPLTPIQRWFFEHDPADRHHWNQSFLFTAPPLDAGALGSAVEDVIRHHDALRLRFRQEAGEWGQRVVPPGDSPPPVEVAELSTLPDGELSAAIARVAERAATSLDLAAGPCIRVVYLRLGAHRGNRLLIVVHHLVVDGVSWRILLEDLESAYRRHVSGTAGGFGPKTTSYRRWAALLTGRATGPGIRGEQPYWTAVSEGTLLAFPGGGREEENTVGNAATVTVSLDPSETTDLLQRVPQAYNTQVNDALLTALAEALTPWAGTGALLLNLEGHGREEIVPGVDTTRTIGWFTSIFPVRLELGRRGDPGLRLKAMKEQLRAIPRRGIGYGILRYLGNDSELIRSPQAQIVFNYLGQFDQIAAGSSLFDFATEDAGPWLAPTGLRRHQIEINALVLNGRLEFRWTYGKRGHDERTIRDLAENMLEAIRGLIRHCAASGVGGRTPSDFPLVALTQDEVDRLAGDGRAIEDILPLAPMQALFLATSGATNDIGFEQWQYSLRGRLNPEALREAWQMVNQRHAILRTGFAVNGVSRPVQVVRRRAETPFVIADWRGITEADRTRRLAELLASDRARGFQVEQPPLLRLHLVRTGDDSWILVWSHHHLLLDRWSWPIVLRDVGTAYRAICAGLEPAWPAAPAWRAYVAELKESNESTAEKFWRHELAGLHPAPLPPLRGGPGGTGEERLDLTADETAELVRTARERRVTVNALVATAWAVCLSRLTGSTDVVLGLTVAGRPEEIPGIANLVGMCINNVPIRLGFDAEEPIATVVERFGERQNAVTPHAQCSLLDLQQWSGLPWHTRLFDTLLVFQHHGAESETANWLGPDIGIHTAPIETHTNYPLALVVGGSERLSLRLAHLGRHAGAEAAAHLLRQLRRVLLALPALYTSAAREAIALAEPAEDHAGGWRDAMVPPRTTTEWVIARIWAELLGKDDVGVETSFFDLGGQSLVATQIMSRVRDAFRIELPVSLLFEHPTVAEFAAALRAREPVPGQVERIAVVMRRVEEMSAADLREAGVHE